MEDQKWKTLDALDKNGFRFSRSLWVRCTLRDSNFLSCIAAQRRGRPFLFEKETIYGRGWGAG